MRETRAVLKQAEAALTNTVAIVSDLEGGGLCGWCNAHRPSKEHRSSCWIPEIVSALAAIRALAEPKETK